MNGVRSRASGVQRPKGINSETARRTLVLKNGPPPKVNEFNVRDVLPRKFSRRMNIFLFFFLVKINNISYLVL